MGDLPAEEQYLHEYMFEEDPPTRAAMKTAALEMVKSHVTDQQGSASMATRVLMKSEGRISCKTPFWWFTMASLKTDNAHVEPYPTNKKLKWDNYSVNWTRHLELAIGTEGDVTEEGM